MDALLLVNIPLKRALLCRNEIVLLNFHVTSPSATKHTTKLDKKII